MRHKKMFLGYCPKCGRDVEVDFCDHCQQYVQPQETLPKTKTDLKRIRAVQSSKEDSPHA